jgi:hypothetical protein
MRGRQSDRFQETATHRAPPVQDSLARARSLETVSHPDGGRIRADGAPANRMLALDAEDQSLPVGESTVRKRTCGQSVPERTEMDLTEPCGSHPRPVQQRLRFAERLAVAGRLPPNPTPMRRRACAHELQLNTPRAYNSTRDSALHTYSGLLGFRRQARSNQVRVSRCVAIKKCRSASGFTVVPPPLLRARRAPVRVPA